MGVKNRRDRPLSRLIKSRRGTAEIVGTIMFLVILLFFFSNVYLWHNQATREMDSVISDKLNSHVTLTGEVVDSTLILKVTNNGGVGFQLSRLWSITSEYPTFDDLYDDNIWVTGGDTQDITYGAPPEEEVTFKIITDLGNTASWKHTPSPENTENPPFSRNSTSTTGFSGVQEGDLLVVIANTRTSSGSGGYPDGGLGATTDDLGFGDAVEVASFHGPGTNHRRAVAIFVKQANGTELGTVDVDWSHSGVSTYAISYQIFRPSVSDVTWTVVAHESNQGTLTPGSSLTVPSTALPEDSTANVMSIAAMVWRGVASSPSDPGNASFSDLADVYQFDNDGAYSATAYSYGLPVTQTTVTWDNSRLASGLLVQIKIEAS